MLVAPVLAAAKNLLAMNNISVSWAYRREDKSGYASADHDDVWRRLCVRLSRSWKLHAMYLSYTLAAVSHLISLLSVQSWSGR
jgi:hypothetical protein